MHLPANTPMKFSSCHNVRELGGYIGENGIRLNMHKLLRGGDLSDLTGLELEQLEAYGIHTCIDLRNDREKSTPDPYSLKDGLKYYAIPMSGNVDDVDFMEKRGELLYHLYINILTNYKHAFLEEMRIIASENDGIIFHCTAGKDRTGLTAMLILALCGVSEEQIIADYETSEENNKMQILEQQKRLKDAGMINIPYEIFQSTSQTMKKTLEYLKKTYGGARQYLASAGLGEEEIEAIRNKMLNSSSDVIS